MVYNVGNGMKLKKWRIVHVVPNPLESMMDICVLDVFVDFIVAKSAGHKIGKIMPHGAPSLGKE
jgi:alpha-tubulin suppressor-like RCC1 family protein